jgi:cobalt-zinc-cadmium resistance protein CzcA
MRDLSVLMVVVLLLIFVVLFSSFGSLLQASLIILTVPLSFLGGIVGLLLAGQSINVSFMTNLVMIVGSIPLAFHAGTGSELHRPLAMVYIGGFMGAILIRMVAMPVLFEVVTRAKGTA